MPFSRNNCAFTLNQDADINGTHKVGAMQMFPQKLREIFGEPAHDCSDGKTCSEFYFESTDPNRPGVFTIYGWKENRDSFENSTDLAWFSVGGLSDPSEFIAWLQEQLRGAK